MSTFLSCLLAIYTMGFLVTVARSYAYSRALMQDDWDGCWDVGGSLISGCLDALFWPIALGVILGRRAYRDWLRQIQEDNANRQ